MNVLLVQREKKRFQEDKSWKATGFMVALKRKLALGGSELGRFWVSLGAASFPWL